MMISGSDELLGDGLVSFSDWGKKKKRIYGKIGCKNHFPVWLESENMADKEDLQSNSGAGFNS